MEIKKDGENIMFGSKIFFSQDGQIKNKAINLMKEKKSTIQEKNKEFIINYPGEYEKYNIYIQTICGETDRLNYFITDYDENVSFAFIQDPSILENLDLSRYPQIWYYTDSIIEQQLERLGFEGEKINISDI